MSQQKIFLVQIEFCKNCSLHNSNTRHDQAKYLFYFQQIKKQVQQNSSYQITVHAMIPPEDLVPANMLQGDNTFYNKRTGELQYFPNLGAFQVYVNQVLVSSKIISNKWPNIDFVVNTILQMYLKNKEDKDLTQYEVGKRVIQKPKHKLKMDPPIYRQSNDDNNFRVRQYQKNFVKKQKQFYDNYIKMSKTIDLGKNTQNQRYNQAMAIDAYNFQSATLNPQVRHRSIAYEKSGSKPVSKAKRRVNASNVVQGSIQKKQPFFPTIDINEAYNPTIEPIQPAIKKRDLSTQKQSRNGKRRQLVKDLRKDALEQALALQHQKAQIEQRLVKFYEKHENLFESLKNSRKISKHRNNLQSIKKNNFVDNKEQQVNQSTNPNKQESPAEQEIEEIQQRYLNEVIKAEGPKQENRFATEQKQKSSDQIRKQKIHKSTVSDKKEEKSSRRKLVGIVRGKNSPVQKQAIIEKPNNKQQEKRQIPSLVNVSSDRQFQKWISNQLKSENKNEQRSLLKKIQQMDESLIRHLNDIQDSEGGSSQQNLQSQSRVRKLLDKIAKYEQQRSKNPNYKKYQAKDAKSDKLNKSPLSKQQRKTNQQRILQFLEKQQLKYKQQKLPVKAKQQSKIQQSPSHSPNKTNNIKIVNTTNIKIDLQQRKPKQSQIKETLTLEKTQTQKPINEKPVIQKALPKELLSVQNKPPVLPKEDIKPKQSKKQEKVNPMQLSIKITDDKNVDKNLQVFEKKDGQFILKKQQKTEAAKVQLTPKPNKIQNIQKHSEQLYKKQKEQALDKLALVMKEKEINQIKKQQQKPVVRVKPVEEKKQKIQEVKSQVKNQQIPKLQQVKLPQKKDQKKIQQKKDVLIESKLEIKKEQNPKQQSKPVETKKQQPKPVEVKKQQPKKQEPKKQEKPIQNVKPQIKAEAKPQVKKQMKPEVKPEVKPQVKQQVKQQIKPEVKQEVKVQPKKQQIPIKTPQVKPQTKNIYHLKIHNLSAQYYKDFDTFGKQDPFLEFNLVSNPQKKEKTQVAKDSGMKAKWQKTIQYKNIKQKSLEQQQIQIKSYDQDVTQNQFMGSGRISIRYLHNLLIQKKDRKNDYKLSLIGSDNTTVIGLVYFSYEIIEQKIQIKEKDVKINNMRCKFLKQYDTFDNMETFLTFQLKRITTNNNQNSNEQKGQPKKTQIVECRGGQSYWNDQVQYKKLSSLQHSEIIIRTYDQDVTQNQYIGKALINIKQLKQSINKQTTLNVNDQKNQIVAIITFNLTVNIIGQVAVNKTEPPKINIQQKKQPILQNKQIIVKKKEAVIEKKQQFKQQTSKQEVKPLVNAIPAPQKQIKKQQSIKPITKLQQPIKQIKKQQPKKEQIKRQQPKKQQPKKEQIKKQQVKKEEIKKQQPKKDEVKREQVKNQQIKKQQAKKQQIRKQQKKQQKKQQLKKEQVKIQNQSLPVNMVKLQTKKQQIPVKQSKTQSKPLQVKEAPKQTTKQIKQLPKQNKELPKQPIKQNKQPIKQMKQPIKQTKQVPKQNKIIEPIINKPQQKPKTIQTKKQDQKVQKTIPDAPSLIQKQQVEVQQSKTVLPVQQPVVQTKPIIIPQQSKPLPETPKTANVQNKPITTQLIPKQPIKKQQTQTPPTTPILDQNKAPVSVQNKPKPQPIKQSVKQQTKQQKPIQKVIEKPIEKVTQKPLQKAIEKPVQKISEKPIQINNSLKTQNNRHSQPLNQSVQKSVPQQTNKPVQPTQQSIPIKQVAPVQPKPQNNISSSKPAQKDEYPSLQQKPKQPINKEIPKQTINKEQTKEVMNKEPVKVQKQEPPKNSAPVKESTPLSNINNTLNKPSPSQPSFKQYKPSNEPVSVYSQKEIKQMLSQNDTKKFLLDN